MKDKKKIKENLEKEKEELLGDLNDIAKLNPETGDWEAVPEKINEPESDQNEMADRFEDYEARSSAVEVFEKRLKKVEEALSEVDKESYGKCDVCGKEIEEDRMEVNPAADTCKEHIKENQ